MYLPVVTEVVGVGFATPVFGHFLGKICEMFHLKYNIPLILSLRFPGFKTLYTALKLQMTIYKDVLLLKYYCDKLVFFQFY